MIERFRRAWTARRDPLVTDRRYDVACLLTWFFYAGWGLGTIFSNLSVFQNLERIDSLYPQVWGGGIGIFSLVATVAAVTTFFLDPGNIQARVNAKRLEAASLCGVLGLLIVYPAVLIFIGDAQGNVRIDIVFLSLSYFPQAVFRVVHLRERIRQLYRYVEGAK